MGRPRSPEPVTDWGSFPDTVLYFRTTPPLTVDLRSRVPQSAKLALRALGFERSFGIITADNPMGSPQPPGANSNRALALREEVAKLHVPRASLDACSPDRSHCEDSIAVGIALESVIAIANRYDQLAVFWFDGDVFWIEPVRSSNSRLPLPVLS